MDMVSTLTDTGERKLFSTLQTQDTTDLHGQMAAALLRRAADWVAQDYK